MLCRTRLSREEYLNLAADKLAESIPAGCLQDLLSRIDYLPLDPEEPGAAAPLAAILDQWDADHSRHRLFYLAVPPSAWELS